MPPAEVRIRTGNYYRRMARLKFVDPEAENCDPAAALVLHKIMGSRNRTVPPNVYAAMANHPAALQTMVEFGTAVYFSNSMSPAQRELAYLTASATNDCHY